MRVLVISGRRVNFLYLARERSRGLLLREALEIGSRLLGLRPGLVIPRWETLQGS